MEKATVEAVARARAQIARRIARFCQNLPPGEFDALLDRMAGIQSKYDSIENISPAKKKRNQSEERQAGLAGRQKVRR